MITSNYHHLLTICTFSLLSSDKRDIYGKLLLISNVMLYCRQHYKFWINMLLLINILIEIDFS